MPGRTQTLLVAWCCLVAAFAAGCATGPDIRINYAPDANFSEYSTFGFPEQTGTDRGGYSTLLTSYFKEAVREQMELRGYRYVDQNPDLLVNFYANVRERTRVRTTPAYSGAYGYYGYRYGLYGAWPLYARDVDVVQYPVGTANIDVVDAERKQMIWEGVAEGRIRESDMERPREAVGEVVAQLFSRFPGKAAAAADARP